MQLFVRKHYHWPVLLCTRRLEWTSRWIGDQAEVGKTLRGAKFCICNNEVTGVDSSALKKCHKINF